MDVSYLLYVQNGILGVENHLNDANMKHDCLEEKKIAFTCKIQASKAHFLAEKQQEFYPQPTCIYKKSRLPYD